MLLNILLLGALIYAVGKAVIIVAQEIREDDKASRMEQAQKRKELARKRNILMTRRQFLDDLEKEKKVS